MTVLHDMVVAARKTVVDSNQHAGVGTSVVVSGAAAPAWNLRRLVWRSMAGVLFDSTWSFDHVA